MECSETFSRWSIRRARKPWKSLGVNVFSWPSRTYNLFVCLGIPFGIASTPRHLTNSPNDDLSHLHSSGHCEVCEDFNRRTMIMIAVKHWRAIMYGLQMCLYDCSSCVFLFTFFCCKIYLKNHSQHSHCTKFKKNIHKTHMIIVKHSTKLFCNLTMPTVTLCLATFLRHLS